MWPVTSLMNYCPAGCFQLSGKVSIFSVEVQTALEHVAVPTDQTESIPWAHHLRGRGAVAWGAK